MSARRARLGLGLAVVAFLAGCVAPPPTLPEGVTASLVQQRSDVAERMASLRVHNGSDALFAFTSIRIDDSRFAEPVELVDERRLEPGTTTELRFALPEVVCDGGAVRRTVTVTSAEVPALVAVLSDVEDFTVGLHERECLLAEVERTVHLAWTDFTPSPPGEPAQALLSVSPTGPGERVVLVGIRSTNLLRFAPRDGEFLPLDLAVAADADARFIEVPLVPQRCDPHVVQEDKRGTIFTVEVAEPRAGTIELAMPTELKARVLTWVGDWCEFGR